MHEASRGQSALVTQAAGQLELEPSHRKGAQLGLPAEPSGEAVQAPRLPVTSQASQLRPQALLQQ